MLFDSLPEITHTMLQPPYRWGNEKLARLEMLLRTDFETTHRHRWDFCSVHYGDAPKGWRGTAGCAIGLAIKTRIGGWGQFGIPLDIEDALFRCHGDWATGYGGTPASVTPLMVADAIRRYMTTGEV